jgi:DnaK suppressor protein
LIHVNQSLQAPALTQINARSGRAWWYSHMGVARNGSERRMAMQVKQDLDPWVKRLKARLEDRREALRAEIAVELGASERDDYARLSSEVHDRGDESLADLLTGVHYAGVERDSAEARDVEAALARIDARAYGRCMDCGNSINPKRLEAYPTAKRCRVCQDRHEQASGGGHPPSL